MSVPLPNVPESSSSSRFLDPDERFEVFQVKAAERPHLLGLDDDNSDEQHPEEEDLPLLDGCDIAAWRREALVGPLSSDLMGALRIGAGSCLFRRESQWPLLPNDTKCPWTMLREELLVPPVKDISRVDAQQVSQQQNKTTKFALEWEERNVPVLIENCTKQWKAMPVYNEEEDNAEANHWNGGGTGGWT